MKTLRTLIFATMLAAAVGGAANLHAQTEADAKGKGKAKTEARAEKPKLSKEEKRAERERRIALKATASTELKVKEGKTPNYNRLLKSTSYALMYTEGLRYYNMKKKGKDYNSLANLRKAQTLLGMAVQSQRFSGTPQDDSLYYYYGCSFYAAQDWQASQDVFDQFRRNFAMSRFIEDAEYKFAMGFYALSPEPRYDQAITLRAISAISEYMGRYPETAHREWCNQCIEELRRKLYTKSYENAKLYYTIGQYKAAVRALNNAIDEYPNSPYREELMYLATRSAWLFAKNSVASQMTDRYLSMMDNYYNLVSEYPETRHLREVEQMRDEARAHIEAHTSEEAGQATTSRPTATDANTTTTTNNGN